MLIKNRDYGICRVCTFIKLQRYVRNFKDCKPTLEKQVGYIILALIQRKYMIQQHELVLPRFKRGYHLITNYLNKAVTLPEQGIMHVFIKHTSAGLTINENADPSVRADYEQVFNRLVPENEPYYTHTAEGSDDMPAHIKATLVGSSVQIPITNYRLNLGVWQGVYLCEFRNNATSRKIVITVYS